VLVLTQTLGYHHGSIPTAMATVRAIAARNGRYRIVFLASAAQLTPAALRHAAAVMFLLTSGELPIGAEKRALVAFVRGGGRLIGFHSATDTFHHWSAYKDMVGAEFSHPPAPEHSAGDRDRSLNPRHARAPRELPDPRRVLHLRPRSAPPHPRTRRARHRAQGT
jgi:hypothetical protein